MIYIPQAIDGWLDDNIPDVAALYDPVTTYTEGSIVRVGNYQYKSTLASNTGNNPIETLGIYWVEWQPANDYAMLDLESGYATEWNADIGYVTFARGSKNYICVGYSNADEIKIEYLDATDTVLDTDVYTFSNNGNVWDEWSYGYGGFIYNYETLTNTTLKLLGTKIKVTLTSTSGEDVYCKFMVSGVQLMGGTTVESVSLPDKRVNETLVETLQFTTIVKDTLLKRILTDAKSRADIPMLFVVDDSENSVFDNIVLIGKATSITGQASNYDYTPITWTLEQTNYNT